MFLEEINIEELQKISQKLKDWTDYIPIALDIPDFDYVAYYNRWTRK